MSNNLKSKRIVVFGATGHLGTHIAIHLKNIGYDVIPVGHRKDDNGFFLDHGMNYISLDISKAEQFERLPKKKIYAIVHFAGALPASMEGYNADLYITSIIQGTKNVLEYTHNVHADRIIFPQSLFDVSYLFGTKVPIPADSLRKAPLKGDHAMYVIAKNAAVDMIEHYYETYGLKRFILRLSRVYMYDPNPYTFTNGKKVLVTDRFFIYQAIEGKDIEVWGDPYRLLETCCIKDFLQIVEKSLIAEVDGGIYNIGSGGNTLLQRVKDIVDVFSPKNKKSKIILCPRKANSSQFVLDIRKTVSELGYEPKYTWKEYLLDFKKEMEEQPFGKLWGYEKDFITKYN
ncbi:MAG: NAD(P)-dependent oxidoreductase [Prevotella sp.]|nr:NAD(P)-dependent oxidoreductase [Prevotella sp.]